MTRGNVFVHCQLYSLQVLGRLLELTFPDSQETWTDTVVYLLKELIIRVINLS